MRCRLIRLRPRRSAGSVPVHTDGRPQSGADRARPEQPRESRAGARRGVRAVRRRADAPRCRGGADNVFRGVIAYGVAWCDNGGEAHRQERNAVHLRGRHLGRRDVRRCRVHADDHDRRHTHPVGGGVADDRSWHHHRRHGEGAKSGATSLTVAGITTAGKVEAKAASTSTYTLARTTAAYITARAATRAPTRSPEPPWGLGTPPASRRSPRPSQRQPLGRSVCSPPSAFRSRSASRPLGRRRARSSAPHRSTSPRASRPRAASKQRQRPATWALGITTG